MAFVTQNNTTTPPHAQALSDGFTQTIPVIPHDAILREGSKVDPASRGKVPGTYRSGGWDGTAGWPEFRMTTELAERFDTLGANVGLKMGWRYAALDVDILDNVTAQAIRTELHSRGIHAPIRVGREPKFLMLFRIADGESEHGIARSQSPVSRDDFDKPQYVEVMGLSRKGRPSQAVFAGTHPSGVPYKWETVPKDATLPLITQAEMDALVETCLRVCDANGWARGKPSGGGRASDGRTSELENPTDQDLLLEVISRIPNDDRTFGDWIRIGLAIRSVFGFDDGWAPWVAFSQKSTTKYTAEITDAEWSSFEPDGSLTFGSLVYEARQGGTLPEQLEERIRTNRLFMGALAVGMPEIAPPAPEFILPDISNLPKPETKEREVEAPIPLCNPLVELGDYARKKGGDLHNCTHNVYLSILSDDRWEGVFVFDLLQSETVVFRAYPSDSVGGPYPRPLTDADFLNVHSWFQQNWFAKVTKTDIIDAIEHAAMYQKQDPIKKYLEGLPTFMPTDLLSNWLFQFFGVKRTGDPMIDGYVRAVGRCWLIGAVARAMRPACQMDNALILEGIQGSGKSSGLRALMPHEDWFGDALPEFGSKEAAEYMAGKWIIELAELTTVIKSEVEDMRRFMTQRHDEFRAAYARKKIKHPRRCVLAGSTNRDDYLKDAQGERRMWPVVCGNNIDVDGIATHRDLLWKEAYTAYMDGEKWHLDPILASYATQQQKARVEIDPWHDRVAEIVDGMDEVFTRYVFDMLGIPIAQWTNATQRKIGAILVRLGYTKGERCRTGAFRDQTKYTLGALK